MQCAAEWQVMCIFKALHKDPKQQHQEISLEDFYSFYELRDLKWKQVSTQYYGQVCCAWAGYTLICIALCVYCACIAAGRCHSVHCKLLAFDSRQSSLVESHAPCYCDVFFHVDD